MDLLGDVYHVVTWFMWNLISVCLETVLVSEQDRCMVYAERTICLEVVLDTTDRTPGDVGHVESDFDPFGDSVSVGAR